MKVKEQCQLKIKNEFAALESLDNIHVDIRRARESIRENIKALAKESLGYYDLKQHKQLFDDENTS